MDNDQAQARHMVKGKWFWMEKAVIRQYAPKVGALGIAVYCYMASLGDARQTCYPSQRHIAHVLGYSRTAINRVIRKLEMAGLVKVDRSGRYQHTYTLLAASCNTEETQV